MFVEDVVEAETKFGVIEVCVAADGVVEKQVGQGERRDRRIVVEGAIVQALGPNGLVEDAGIPSTVLIREAFRQDVGGSIRHPEAAGRGDV